MTTSDDTLTALHNTLRATLNSETSKIAWPELQRHFARGVVVVVDKELDLIEVAVIFAEDNKPQTAHWIQQGQIRTATDTDGMRWQANTQSFWAVVVAPWVLAQEIAQ